ncbi:MAG: 30S ribosomal protein S8e [Candidatus Marsarchaeota archaeon]|nr:30S ribosomal protein S8e [Candidatus Marsarchaeota archaeon]
MSYYQGNDNRLITGSVKSFSRGKRKYELGGHFTATLVGKEDAVRPERGRGGNIRLRLIRAASINLVDDQGKVQKVKVESIVRTPANVEYARRGIVTKGTIVKTELGQARVTSTPGRDGVLNGVLIKETKAQ